MKSQWLGALLVLLLADVSPAITPTSEEQQLATLVKNHSGQRRTLLLYDSVLHVVARAKALDLARRDYYGHLDPDGYGPNMAVRLAGYKLPTWWSNDLGENYIESIAASHASVNAALTHWMASSDHRDHLLAEHPFYLDQTRYGVGVVTEPGSSFGKYFVFITAPPNLDGDNRLTPYTEWLFAHFTPKRIHLENDLNDADGDGLARIVEFVLQMNPASMSRLPSPLFHVSTGRLEWTLPIRPDLGNVLPTVQTSTSLANGTWTTSGISRSGNTFSVPVTGRAAYLRLQVTR